MKQKSIRQDYRHLYEPKTDGYNHINVSYRSPHYIGKKLSMASTPFVFNGKQYMHIAQYLMGDRVVRGYMPYIYEDALLKYKHDMFNNEIQSNVETICRDIYSRKYNAGSLKYVELPLVLYSVYDGKVQSFTKLQWYVDILTKLRTELRSGITNLRIVPDDIDKSLTIPQSDKSIELLF